MSEKPASSKALSPYALGLTAIFVAGLPSLWLINVLVGPIVAIAAGTIFGASLCLAFLRRGEPDLSRDPQTGLPDRSFALASLAEIMNTSAAGHAEATVIVVSLDLADETVTDEDRRALALLMAVRMAHRLRKGDQIVRVSDTALAAILGPSLGITAQSTVRILERIGGMFGDRVRIGDRTIVARVAIGACLQHDAPEADAQSWLEAAERAAEMAAEAGKPRLFPSGATTIDCLFDPAIDDELERCATEARWRQDAAKDPSASAAGERRDASLSRSA